MDTDIWIHSCLWEHVFQNVEGPCSVHKQKTPEEGEEMQISTDKNSEIDQ